VRKAYGSTFDRLREGLRQAEKVGDEIQTMLTGTFRQLNAEYGFALQAPREPDLARYERDLDLVERSHNQYLGVSNALRLAQPEFADRLVRALATRLRVIYESALGEVELWNKSAAAQLDAQLRERRRNFGRRLEAIERIQQAASGWTTASPRSSAGGGPGPARCQAGRTDPAPEQHSAGHAGASGAAAASGRA
jgi:hypothetical protein